MLHNVLSTCSAIWWITFRGIKQLIGRFNPIRTKSAETCSAGSQIQLPSARGTKKQRNFVCRALRIRESEQLRNERGGPS